MTRTDLKRVVLTLLAICGYVLLLPVWRRLQRHRGGATYRILTYHSITSDPSCETRVEPEDFDRHMAFLAARTYVLPLDELVHGRPDAKAQEACTLVALTFDDGYADNVTVALPVLARYRLTATCFLTTAYIGTEEHLPQDTARVGDTARLLTWDEVRTWQQAGMSVGSHGMHHVRHANLENEEQRDEAQQSRVQIASQLGDPPYVFAFPYGKEGDYSGEAIAIVMASGYKAVASAQYGINRVGCCKHALRRIGIESSDTLFTLRAKTDGALDLLMLLEFPLARKWIDRLNRRRGA